MFEFRSLEVVHWDYWQRYALPLDASIITVVGPNGSGKTTLLNAITGFYPPQEGTITLDGQQINGLKPFRIASMGVARTFQNVALFHGMSVLDNILMGRHIFMKPNPLASFFYP